MYHLSDDQIDFIAADLRARGLEMESLRENLLDHICCIIEKELEANGDFRQFYDQVIRMFYKTDLREIESETNFLLQNKNYYHMKRSMIISGILASVTLSAGIFLKFIYAPGASVLMFLGIILFSFVFLPLMFILGLKEKEKTRDKILLGLGLLVTALFSLGTLFKVMHWPGANMMGLTSILILLLAYLPINLFTGIRNPATKINTIISSILLVAGCGIFLSLVRTTQGSRKLYIQNTEFYLHNDELYRTEIAHPMALNSAFEKSEIAMVGKEILGLSEDLKKYILQKETGHPTLNENFIHDQAWLSETYTSVYFEKGTAGYEMNRDLQQKLQTYNHLCEKSGTVKPMKEFSIIYSAVDDRVYESLNKLVQLQLYILQNERIISAELKPEVALVN